MRRVVRKSTRAGIRDARSLLETALVAELVSPGHRVHLRSPWITDVAVLDNRAGTLTALVPGVEERFVHLSELLTELARRGARVVVECRPDPINSPFLSALRSRTPAGSKLAVWSVEDLHEKLLATDGFVIGGSMNFTQAGLDKYDEQLWIDADPVDVAKRWLELENAPQGQGTW